MQDTLNLYGKTFAERFLLGTAGYPSMQTLKEAIAVANPAMITVAVRRQSANQQEAGQGFWNLLQNINIPLLPNTAGCQTVKEAVATAQMAREIFNTNWIKLEIIADNDTLQPDPFQLPVAAELLIKDGFNVLPYCTEDLTVCRKLIDVGCQVLMPWAAPIGSALGVVHEYALRSLRERLPEIPLIIDAGLGLPSHAAQVMEYGFDGVLLNSAVAHSNNPIQVAQAFALATKAGRLAFLGTPPAPINTAKASTPTIGMPFWHSKEL